MEGVEIFIFEARDLPASWPASLAKISLVTARGTPIPRQSHKVPHIIHFTLSSFENDEVMRRIKKNNSLLLDCSRGCIRATCVE